MSQLHQDRDIVLLHGALGTSTQMQPLGEVLSFHCRVHYLDFEGHANVPAGNRPFRMEHFAENVIALLDEHGIERAELFGYSMGGYVALVLAATKPDRVARVTTLGTKFRWDPATSAREAARLDPAVIRAKVPHYAATLDARHTRRWKSVVDDTREMLIDLGDHPMLTDDVLARIEQPVHIFVGDQDETVSEEEAKGVAAVLPDCHLSMLANTPHAIEKVDVESLAHHNIV